MTSGLVSGDLSFSFCSEQLLLFFMVFDELIHCWCICGNIRSQIPPATISGEEDLCFQSCPFCWKLCRYGCPAFAWAGHSCLAGHSHGDRASMLSGWVVQVQASPALMSGWAELLCLVGRAPSWELCCCHLLGSIPMGRATLVWWGLLHAWLCLKTFAHAPGCPHLLLQLCWWLSLVGGAPSWGLSCCKSAGSVPTGRATVEWWALPWAGLQLWKHWYGGCAAPAASYSLVGHHVRTHDLDSFCQGGGGGSICSPSSTASHGSSPPTSDVWLRGSLRCPVVLCWESSVGWQMSI